MIRYKQLIRYKRRDRPLGIINQLAITDASLYPEFAITDTFLFM